jgi:hypothetical protein
MLALMTGSITARGPIACCGTRRASLDQKPPNASSSVLDASSVNPADGRLCTPCCLSRGGELSGLGNFCKARSDNYLDRIRSYPDFHVHPPVND